MRRGRRAWLVNGVLVVAMAAAGWGAYVLLWPGPNEATPSGTRTVAVTTADVVESVSAAATVQSSYTGTADFATSGTVTQIYVKVGDTVGKGQQLAKVDDTQARLQLAAAKSGLSAAKENLATALTSTGSTSAGSTGAGSTGAGQGQQSTKSLQAQVDQAKVNVDQAEQALAATTLTAPGDGTVTAVTGAVGQRTGSGGSAGSSGSGSSGGSGGSGSAGSGASAGGSSGFVTITNLTGLQVRANLAEIDVAKVKAGQDATVTLNALPDAPQPAKVTAVDLTATTGSNSVVTYGVTLTVDQPPAQLRPGQSASVAITVAKADNAVAIPSAAMRTVGTSHTVTVLANGQETSRAIEIGVRGESLVQVVSGLAVGDQVVLTKAPTQENTGGQQRGGNTPFGGGGSGGGGIRVQPGGGGR